MGFMRLVWWAVDVAATFTWLGMVLAISFMETPLKFRAPGVTLVIGLGIGRVVFRALNIAEVVLGILVIAATVAGSAGSAEICSLVALAALAVQLVLVRPRLHRRTLRLLAGGDRERSPAHLAYVSLEVVKILALLTAGVLLEAAR